MAAKSILITGCSSGIGFHAATRLKEKGYRVFASARKERDVIALSKLGFESVPLDICDTHSIAAALAYIQQTTDGTLDAVFNNAGILLVGSIEDLTEEQIQKVFATNTFGPINLIKQTLPIMRKQGYGRLIQNSSILGIVTLPFYGAYNASKYALEGFTNTLRQELRNSNIFVSNINAGAIQSKLRNNAYQEYLHTLAIKPNVHDRVYKKIEMSYFRAKNKLALSPEAFVKKLLLALESRTPKAHYYVAPSAQAVALLKRILPERMLDWVLTKFASQE